ncbi:pro-FMRFamide-related neuropeptide VF [Ammospiza nelsoni]|uniref:pro-FMRFamide-related neuropeptide VF n=1 Tax=Ammospiza nelsoni TaxID=2857394 RepID=UPI00286986A3|nr:pro-FMRFamide-related neuropeptide VF [Ammospiza nelsoni]
MQTAFAFLPTVQLQKVVYFGENHFPSVKQLLIFTSIVESMCLNEAMKSRLQSREDNDDKDYEIKDNILEEKQRSLNFEEMEDWGSKDIIKMNPFTASKMPNSVANLPLRFGRNYPEERSIKPFSNLPLRFGRAFGENIPNHSPRVSHRLERSPLVKGSSQSLLNLPQRFGKSLAVNLPRDIQEFEPGNATQVFKPHIKMHIKS